MRKILALAAALVIPVAASAGVDLVPHRAAYDMDQLKRSTDSAFVQVDGRMVYHYDRTCESVTYNHRMLLDLVSKQGVLVRSETVLSFFETSDGLSMRFQVRELLNDRVLVELEGSVTRKSVDSPAVVTYTKRKGAEGEALATLQAGALFPLQHTNELIQAAMAGETVHNSSTFDGDEVSDVGSFIQPAKQGREDELLPSEMDGMKSWLTRVAFYKPNGDELPFYETQMRFWPNGLSGDFTMESPELGIVGHLTEVELFESPVCN